VVADVRGEPNQLRLRFAEIEDDTQIYEYAVLVTSLEAEVLTVAQLYRDRADCENAFDVPVATVRIRTFISPGSFRDIVSTQRRRGANIGHLSADHHLHN
jgi:hypothetical protein